MKIYSRLRNNIFFYLIGFIGFIIISHLDLSFASDNSFCATVKIEIKQELTLERQAFDAHMRINNGLSHISLEHVNVNVKFTDGTGNNIIATSDPNNTSALFFIRIDTMSNINNVTGSGTVAPSSSADIHWLIIPASGASKEIQQGTLYYVGAKLTYTIGGQEHITEVTPDYIFVKPMPEITLDYFLSRDVYGDDPFTPETEPKIPFSLGVRLKNSGFGTAKNLKIESAQPKIIDNKLGLLVGFVIEGSEVNGKSFTPSLLADFGDILPDTSVNGRWVMTCTLSGKFVEFTAQYSHSDELGGKLTSLIKQVRTHTLVHDILVDLPGRDTINDFLAKENDGYRVYESDSVDTEVSDQSSDSNLQYLSHTYWDSYYELSTPVTAGFMYVKLSDPSNGQKILKQLVRSDGKIIHPDNAWLSQTREGSNPWEYYFNLFDTNSTGSYKIVFQDPLNGPQPPIIQFIPDQTKSETQQISFIVLTGDVNETIPSLSTSSLPAGAKFIDQKDGSGIFDWTPIEGQAGTYEVTFIASDGELQSSQRCTFRITPNWDRDNDSMADEWETTHFDSMSVSPDDDYDGDGLTNLEEFNLSTLPKVADTDNDGHEDGAEVYNKTDPLNRKSYQMIVYVNKATGDDSWDGTCPVRIGQLSGGPKKTIANALLAAEEKYTVKVYSGEYAENLVLDKTKVSIISDAGSATAIIIGSSDIATIIVNKESTITGFTVRNSNGDGILVNNSKLILENSILTECKSSGLNCIGSNVRIAGLKIFDNKQNGIFLSNNSSLNIVNCQIFNNLIDAITSQNSNCTISNSVIDNNLQTGLSLSSSNAKVEFATIYGNNVTGIELSNNSTLNMKNSIVWGSTNQITKTESDTTAVVYCDVQNTYDGEGNIDLYPEFDNTSERDYHLKSISLCIDAGDPYQPKNLTQLDLDGNFRYIDGTNQGSWNKKIRSLLSYPDETIINWGQNLIPDMGAYEYTGENKLSDLFILEISNDLINWQNLYSGKKSNYIDDTSKDMNQRFYRVIKSK